MAFFVRYRLFEAENMSTLMSGARMLVECLVREGVDCIFGYPGGVTIPFYDVLYEHRIRHVLVRHEENAAFAAEGYAHSACRSGVAFSREGRVLQAEWACAAPLPAPAPPTSPPAW